MTNQIVQQKYMPAHTQWERSCQLFKKKRERERERTLSYSHTKSLNISSISSSGEAATPSINDLILGGYKMHNMRISTF